MNMEAEKQRKGSLASPGSRMKAAWEVLLVAAKLGCTSFGGPVAHLGYFHKEYVDKRKWLDERSYAELVALGQFLPGPASSQVGIGIGVLRAGLPGGLAAWLGFTLPSVIVMVLFALLLTGFGVDVSTSGWIHGLKIVAVAIVAQAVLSMGQKLAADKSRATIAVAAAAVTLLWPTALNQMLLIAVAAVIGRWLYEAPEGMAGSSLAVPVSRRAAWVCIVVFAVLLLLLPIVSVPFASDWLTMFGSFYRSGSLVFGGGHVVLPLLEREVVPTGMVSGEQFLAGYGVAQAVPGPLFTFAAYLGAAAGGITGAVVATAGIFLPAFLLMVGALPFWGELRQNKGAQGALQGVNAAVVGILLAALYDPLWKTAVTGPAEFSLAALLFLLLVFWKLPPWVIVLAGMGGGMLLGYL
jgi:chromate transporter